jgi:KaiC/GvpD/RAD55 family RecA-like ATPase
MLRFLWTKRIAVKKTALHAAFTTSGKKNVDQFFNRVDEIKNSLLEGDPQFTVLLGPPSSGKTRFIRHVVEQKDPHLMEFQQAKFFPLFVNLRGVKVNEEDWFAMAFEKEVEKFRRYLKSVEVSGNGVRVDFVPIEHKQTQKQKPEPIIVKTFDKLVSFCEKSPRPGVLVIDEANKLMLLADKNPEDFRTFMDGVVKVTKEDRRLHVVFTSSDSFFEKWLTGPNGRCLFLHINEWADKLFSSWA